MQCRTCGTLLSPGTAFCSYCGSPVTTMRPNGMPDMGNDQTVLSVNAPPPPPPSSYNAPPVSQVPPDPYSVTPVVPIPSDPYSVSPMSQASYPTPVIPNSNPINYGNTPLPYPSSYSNGTIPATPGSGTFLSPDVNTLTATPPLPAAPKKRRRGWLIGLVVGIIVLLLAGSLTGFFGLATLGGQNDAAATATANAANGVPADTSVVTSASTIFSSLQISSAVDSNYSPTNVTSTFTAGQTVYITFAINSNGNDGYIMGRWYLDGTLVYHKQFHHIASHNFGYFSLPYQRAGNGAFALYWCTQSDCSDAQLAHVAHFTITN